FALGRPRESFDHIKLALDFWQKSLGASQKTVMALGNLGEAKLAMHEPDEALRYFEAALEACNRALGASHWLCGEDLSQIGEPHPRINHLGEATSHFQRALAVGEKALGPKHPRLVAPLIGIGRVQLAQGATASAKSAIVRALAIREAKPGDGMELA